MHKKKHRQHKNVELNRRQGLRVGGVVVPYWPSYYWGGGGVNPNPQPDSDNTGDSTGTTTDGAANAGDAGASGANA